MFDDRDVEPLRGDVAVTRLDGPAKTRLDATTLHADTSAVDRDDSHDALITNLPAALDTSYVIERQLIAVSGEADLFLVRPRTGEPHHFVAKVYRYGTRPKSGVLEVVSKSNPEHVIQVYEHGQSSGRAYELLEYFQHGSLDDLHPPGRPLAEDRVLAVLDELTSALHHLHQQGIIHRDLKPANVLVRTLEPLDLVLTDFGIASSSHATVHYTSAHRTIRYAAPETIAGEVSTASDYWSLGIMLVELLTGRHPLDGMSEVVMQAQIVKRDLPTLQLEAPWNLLCGGLLLRDPGARWQHDEIRRWIDRDPTLVLPESRSVASHRPYTFNRESYSSPAALADALALHEEEAEKHLKRGYVSKWLSDEVRDYELASNVQDLTERFSDDRELLILTVTTRLAAGRPATFRGLELTQAALARSARAVLSDGDGAQLLALKALSGGDVLALYAEVSQNEELACVAALWKARLQALSSALTELTEALRMRATVALPDTAEAIALITVLDPAQALRYEDSAKVMLSDPNDRVAAAPSIVRRYRAAHADPTAVDIAVIVIGASARAEAEHQRASAALLARAGAIDVDEVRSLLAAGANVDGPRDSKLTPLMVAVENNDDERVIEALVDAGASLEAGAEGGGTPLILAILANRSVDLVRALIEAGARLETTNRLGRSPLVLAARFSNDPRVVDLLLKAGAPLTPEVWTAARRNDNKSIVLALNRTHGQFAPAATSPVPHEAPTPSATTPESQGQAWIGCAGVIGVLLVISLFIAFPWVGLLIVVGGALLAYMARGEKGA